MWTAVFRLHSGHVENTRYMSVTNHTISTGLHNDARKMYVLPLKVFKLSQRSLGAFPNFDRIT